MQCLPQATHGRLHSYAPAPMQCCRQRQHRHSLLGKPAAPGFVLQLHGPSVAVGSAGRSQQQLSPERAISTPQPPAAGAEAARMAQLQQQLERQCQRPPVYVPAPDALGRAKQLTADISHKQHWSQLQNMWLDNSAEFSHFHLTATLCRLARLVCRDGIAAADRPEVFKLSGALLSAVWQSAVQLDSRGLAQCLWAYAKLQSAAPHSSSSGDAAAATLTSALLTQGHMQQLQPAQLSQTAWAAAHLQAMGMALPRGWWTAVEQRAVQLMPLLKPCEAACCSWAVTKNGHRLVRPLVQALQDHVVYMAASYGPGELLQVMLAVAAAQQGQPQQQQQQCAGSVNSSTTSGFSRAHAGAWVSACYTRLQQEAGCMSAQEVSTAFLALSRLGARNRPSSLCSGNCHQLPLSLSTRLLKRGLDMLPSSSPRDLVAMAYALAHLELNPGPWWWGRFLPYSAAALHVCSPSMLAVLAWSLAKLGVQPGAGWTQELLQHAGFKVQGLGVQESTMLLYALGKWRACPELRWWTAFEDATQHMMPYFTAAELAGLLSGMGNTGPPPAQQQLLQPGVLWRTKPDQDPEQQLQQPQGDYIPGGAWTAAMLVSAQAALSGAPADALGGIITGLAKLAVHPSTTWMDAFEAAVLAAMPAASLKDVAALLWGLSVMGVQPSRAVVQATDIRIMSVLRRSQYRHAGIATGTAAHAVGVAGQGGGLAALAADELPAAHAETGAAHAAALVVALNAAHAAAAPQPLQKWSELWGAAADGLTPAAAAADAGRPSAAVTAQLLWSVSQLPEPEGVAAWADDLVTAVLPSLQHASQETLFVLLRSLAWLNHVPGYRQWLDMWWQAYAAHLQHRTAAAAGVLAAATSTPVGGTFNVQQHGADSKLLQQQQRQQQQQRHDQDQHQHKVQLQPCSSAEATCQQLTVILWCFRQLRSQPSQGTGWLQTIAAVTQPLLHQVSAARLGLLLGQLAQLHVWPGDAWLATAEAVLQQQRQHMSCKQVQQSVVSMQMMGRLLL